MNERSSVCVCLILKWFQCIWCWWQFCQFGCKRDWRWYFWCMFAFHNAAKTVFAAVYVLFFFAERVIYEPVNPWSILHRPLVNYHWVHNLLSTRWRNLMRCSRNWNRLSWMWSKTLIRKRRWSTVLLSSRQKLVSIVRTGCPSCGGGGRNGI